MKAASVSTCDYPNIMIFDEIYEQGSKVCACSNCV